MTDLALQSRIDTVKARVRNERAAKKPNARKIQLLEKSLKSLRAYGEIRVGSSYVIQAKTWATHGGRFIREVARKNLTEGGLPEIWLKGTNISASEIENNIAPELLGKELPPNWQADFGFAKGEVLNLNGEECKIIDFCWVEGEVKAIIVMGMEQIPLSRAEVQRKQTADPTLSSLSSFDAKAQKIRALSTQTAKNIIEIGGLLCQVKAKLEHGSFGLWIKNEFGWGHTVATQYMQIYRKFHNCKNLEGIGSSALRLLASPSVSDETRQKAIETAKEEGALGVTRARLLIQSAKGNEPEEIESLVTPAGKDQIFPDCDEHREPPDEYYNQPQDPKRYEVFTSALHDEHYTPPNLIKIARKTMGEIEVDPASSDIAQETVQAQKYFTLERQITDSDWRGKVWLNPPFSKISDWVNLLVGHFSDGNVTEAVLLTKLDCRTKWFARLMSAANAFGMVRGNVRFSQAANTAQFGVALWYFGESVDRFYHAAKDDCWICQELIPGISFGE